MIPLGRPGRIRGLEVNWTQSYFSSRGFQLRSPASRLLIASTDPMGSWLCSLGVLWRADALQAARADILLLLVLQFFRILLSFALVAMDLYSIPPGSRVLWRSLMFAIFIEAGVQPLADVLRVIKCHLWSPPATRGLRQSCVARAWATQTNRQPPKHTSRCWWIMRRRLDYVWPWVAGCEL